jgi:hypothetical protein
MGFFDRLDTALATAIAGHGAQKEARQFAASVTPGQTYYSVVDLHLAWGKGRALMEWVFTEPSRLTGQPMCGHLSAAGVWLTAGPIHARRPGGLKTLSEMRRGPEFPPDPAMAIESLGVTPARV